MPLSEDEQRILRQIEQELRSDPSFAERGYEVSRGRLIGLALAFVVGIVLTIAALTFNAWVAFAAFIGVLVVAVLLERELRIVSRERLGDLPINAWLAGARRRHDNADDK